MPKALNIRGAEGEVFNTSTGRSFPLGTRMHTASGRVFRYARAGAAAISAARTVAQPQELPEAEIRNRLISAATFVGANSLVIVYRTGTQIQANDYEDGLLYVNDGQGEGHIYPVSANAPMSIYDTTMTVHLDAPLQVRLDATTSRVTLLKNRYTGLREADAPPTSPLAGVAPVAVAANSYFWCQTGGPAAVLQQGPMEQYLPVAASRKRDGAVALAAVVIPSGSDDSRSRVGATGLAIAQALDTNAADVRERLAPISGIGVLPDITIGYVLDPQDEGDECLVHLQFEQ